MSAKKKLAIANKAVYNQMQTIDALNKELNQTEKYLEMAERELQVKERMIIEYQEWIETLIKSSE